MKIYCALCDTFAVSTFNLTEITFNAWPAMHFSQWKYATPEASLERGALECVAESTLQKLAMRRSSNM
jgi:hypothetical protein